MKDTWTKSSLSGGDNSCVEWRADGDDVVVRDSKLGDGSPELRFSPDEWDAFVGGVRQGEADRA
jgi:hypothetical protein